MTQPIAARPAAQVLMHKGLTASRKPDVSTPAAVHDSPIKLDAKRIEISQAARSQSVNFVAVADQGSALTNSVAGADDRALSATAERVMNELRAAFFAVKGDGRYNPMVDLNHDGAINPLDLAIIRGKIASATTGPSDAVVDDTPLSPEAMLSTLRTAFFARAGDENFNAAVDLNSDGVIDVRDLGLARARVAGQANQKPQENALPALTSVTHSAGLAQGPVQPEMTIIDDQTVPDDAQSMLLAIRNAFFAQTGDENFNAAVDLNNDGVINVRDLGLARARLASQPDQKLHANTEPTLAASAQPNSGALASGPSQPDLTVINDQTAADDGRSTLKALLNAFFARAGDENFNAAVDLNHDGVVNVRDLGLVRARAGGQTTQPVPPTIDDASASRPLARMIEILRAAYASN